MKLSYLFLKNFHNLTYWQGNLILCCEILLFQLTFFTIQIGKVTIFFEKTLI